jgi:hypothetical protein
MLKLGDEAIRIYDQEHTRFHTMEVNAGGEEALALTCDSLCVNWELPSPKREVAAENAKWKPRIQMTGQGWLVARNGQCIAIVAEQPPTLARYRLPRKGRYENKLT